MASTPEQVLQGRWLGREPFERCLERQLQIRDAVIAGAGPETLLLVEHPPTLTLGRLAEREDIRWSDAQLAALELNVKSLAWHDAAVLEVQLPAGVEADDRLLAALRANGVVRDAEAREPGFARMTLAPLEPQQQVAIALPLRWRAAGRVRGLAVVGYSAATPERMTVLPARVLEVGAEQ